MAGKLKDETMTPSSSRNCANHVETSNANKMAHPSRNLDVNLNNKAENFPSKHKENESGTKTLGLMSLNDNKAGMTGLDKEKINQIIENASKGSKFYAKQKENQARIDAQIENLKARQGSLTPKEIFLARQEADSYVQYLNQGLDLSRTIVHVDMDMFYAAVEMRDNTNLRDKPMAVGGMGMLSTSNYAARKFGVRAAMPGFIGKKLCPELVIVPVNMQKYADESKLIREVFSEYDENFAPMSLDEAYIDITDYLLLHPDANAWDSVQEMREKIFAKTKLTASAGIAPNTFLAKVCSDLNKPNGQYVLEPDQNKILEFVKDLPIRKAPGIGNVQEQLLRSIGVKTCNDLYELRAEIKLLFSQLSFEHYLQIAQGIGSTRLEPPEDRIRKSISTETTFKQTSDRNKLFELCDGLSDELAETMKEKEIYGQAVSIKIKSHDFKLKTKIRQITTATNSADVIKSTAKQLLQQLLDSSEQQPLALRLLGVRMSELKSKEELGTTKQKSIFSFLQQQSNKKGTGKSTLGQTTSSNGTLDVATNIEVSEFEEIDEITPSTSRTAYEQNENEYACPVCERSILGLNNLNNHVDRCLSQGMKEEPSNSINTNENLEDIETDNLEAKDIEKEKSTKILVEKSSDLNIEKEKQKETSENDNDAYEETKVTCPVCFKATFQSEVELNQHIDVCLNSETIQNVLNSRSPAVKQPAVFGSLLSSSSTTNNSRKRKSSPLKRNESTFADKKGKLSTNKIDTYFRRS